MSCWGSASELAIFKGLIAEFEAQHPDIHIELLHSPDSYFQKLHILIASDLTPDVMMVNSLSLPVYSSHDVFLPLNNTFETPGFPLKESYFFQGALDALSRPDSSSSELQRYAIPRDVSNLVVYVNKAHFKKAGLTLPRHDWTFEEYKSVAQTLTIDADGDGHPEQFGASFFPKPPLYWLPFVWSEGGQVFNEPMTAITLTQPDAIAGLQFLADLRNKWHVAPQNIDTGGVTMSQLFIQGKLSTMVNGRWMVPALREQKNLDWDVLPFPRGKAGSVVGIDASGYAIAAKTPHKEAALAWVAFLSSKEALIQWSQSGLIIPARHDVAESDVFLSPGQRPEHSRTFLDVIATGQPTRTPPKWDEFSEELLLSLEPVWQGQQSAQDALEQSAPKLNHILEAP